MADVVPAEKFEIGDTEYRVQRGEENLENQFDRADIHDISGAPFEPSSMRTGVFSDTPTINHSLSSKFENSNFSATDDEYDDAEDRSSFSHLEPASPNFEETPMNNTPDKEVTGIDDDSESEEDTPSFVDYDAAVVAQKVPLDFLVSNTAFLAGCVCYDVTTVARIMSPSWYHHHIHSLTLLQLFGAILYIFNSLTGVTGMVKMEQNKIQQDGSAAQDDTMGILNSAGCLNFAEISSKTGKVRIGWRMWGIIFFLWGSVLYFWSSILLFADDEHVIGRIHPYVSQRNAKVKPPKAVDHSDLADALNFLACLLMFASAIVSMMDRTWFTRHPRNKHNQRIDEGVIIVSCCFTNCFACKHAPTGDEPEPDLQLGWRSRVHRESYATDDRTVVRCSAELVRACRRAVWYVCGGSAFECWLPRPGGGKETGWEKWAFVPACDFGAWGDLFFLIGSITDLVSAVHDFPIWSLIGPPLWTINAILYVCQDCLQQQQQRRRKA